MFGRRGVFGKRQSEPARPAFGPQDRVFEPGLWDGERGALLRKAGFAPDDPKNQLALQEPVSERLARDDAALSRSLMALNRASPHPIGAFTLLREELWRGRFGAFLLQRLDLSPFRPWNVVFLPLDPAGTAALGLPIGDYDEGDVAEIEVTIAMIAELFSGSANAEASSVARMLDDAAGKTPYLFPSEILDYSPEVRDARRRVRAFAFVRASTNHLDREVILRSQRTFLGKPEEQLVA